VPAPRGRKIGPSQRETIKPQTHRISGIGEFAPPAVGWRHSKKPWPTFQFSSGGGAAPHKRDPERSRRNATGTSRGPGSGGGVREFGRSWNPRRNGGYEGIPDVEAEPLLWSQGNFREKRRKNMR